MRSIRIAALAILLALFCVGGAASQGAPPQTAAEVPARDVARGAALRARVAIDERIDGPATLAEATTRPGIEVIARITVPARLLREGRTSRALIELSRRLDRYRGRNIPVWIALEIDLDNDAALDTITTLVRTLTGDGRPRTTGAGIAVYEIALGGNMRVVAHRGLAYVLKRAALDLLAASPQALVGIGGEVAANPAALESLFKEELAAYIDLVSIPHRSRDGGLEGANLDALVAILARDDPTAVRAESGVPLTSDAPHAIVRSELWRIGTALRLTSYKGSSSAIGAALARATSVADLLSPDLVRLDPSSRNLMLTDAEGHVTSVRHALLFDPAKFATTLIYEGSGEVPRELTISLTLRERATPSIRDPLSGARLSAVAISRDDASQQIRVTAPLRATPLVLDVNDGLLDLVTERSEVGGRALLSVGEILARHQQARAAQDRLVSAYVVRARMEQHFRPAITDPGFDVVTDNRFFADRDGVEWEELSFSVNGTRWGADRPAFPLLQPEKVLAPPLDLELNASYRYRLTGVDTSDGTPCYVVAFDPIESGRALYRGAVWIDTASFRRVKLRAVQTGLTGHVVSNEETIRFAPVATVDDRPIVLPVESVGRQIVLIAGRNLLIEKTTTFRGYEINPEDFVSRRTVARKGDRVMYRDTDRGTRYYVKEGDGRIVSERATTSAKAMAVGVTLDPSFGFPLPIFGINYLDFAFGGPDSQLALLFGGVLALGNVQRPRLLGSPLDGSVDFFAIAVPGSDRVYDASGEREAERLLTWPLSGGMNLGYQFTSFQKVSAQYQLRFDAYIHDRTTDESYRTPSTTLTNGLGLSYEYKRGGYSILANGTWYGRARWEPWGPVDAVTRTPSTYEKYSINLSKDFFLNLFSKVHVNAAYFGGRRLDRFSQYQFGLFDDTRIHGVPASGVRFGELAMVRGSYSFNVFEQYRFDVFLEHAMGRDGTDARPGGAGAVDPWERITGIGAAMNVRGPWRTMLRIDAGKSFLPERYRSTGSTVVQVLMLKPL
jgi:hypothetical protein